MVKRIIQERVELSLAKYPVVGILNPRQVGKTTLAKMIMYKVKKKVTYLDMELNLGNPYDVRSQKMGCVPIFLIRVTMTDD